MDHRRQWRSGPCGRTADDALMTARVTRDVLEERVVNLGWVSYALALWGWAGAWRLWGDRWVWLFVLNTFAPFLFVPLPFLILFAVRLRRRVLGVSACAGVVLWGLLYAELWLPQTVSAPAGETRLTVMTYNLLVGNHHFDQVRQTIGASDADVVAFQELTPQVAAMIQQELRADYPYQILAPTPGTRGMGVISRYPLAISALTLDGDWNTPPQVLTLDFAGTAVTLLHTHFQPTTSPNAEVVSATVARRMQQARAVQDFAAQHPDPLLVVCDGNMAEFSREYAVLARAFKDAWREAGWGLGLTWPTPSGYVGLGRWLGLRLARIDYLWYSTHFQAARAALGAADGYSDHRPVVATLVWR